MADFVIRTACAEDLPSVSDLFRRSSLSNAGDRDDLLANPDALVFDGLSIREGRSRVALDDGRIVGFVTTRAIKEIVELDDLFVDPDWMRRGVARALLLDVVARARVENVARIEVTANSHARGFYDSVGFVADGVIETRFGIGTRMHLNVEPEAGHEASVPSTPRQAPPYPRAKDNGRTW